MLNVVDVVGSRYCALRLQPATAMMVDGAVQFPVGLETRSLVSSKQTKLLVVLLVEVLAKLSIEAAYLY